MAKVHTIKKGGVPVKVKLLKDENGAVIDTVVIAQTRYMVPCVCECCGHILKRAVQDLSKTSFGKGTDECPNCGAKVVWDKGLLPDGVDH